LAGFEAKKAELDALGVSVYAGSVDTGDRAAEVANEVSFPVAQGISREVGDALGAWWDPKRGFVQPTEFLTKGDGTIIQASYSDGPLARTLVDDVLALVGFYQKSRG
jgi:peroxiredoxin